jgi:hypothetical protein
MATAQPTPVAWEQFRTSHEWRALSPARKVWVAEFIVGSDAFAATRKAYPKAKDKSARCMTYQLRKNPEIVAALEFYQGGLNREMLISEVRAQLRAAEPGSIAAAQFATQLERLTLGITLGRRKHDDDDADNDSKPTVKTPKPGASSSRVPAGATALADKNGVIRGYRTATGEYVQLADVEVSR